MWVFNYQISQNVIQHEAWDKLAAKSSQESHQAYAPAVEAVAVDSVRFLPIQFP